MTTDVPDSAVSGGDTKEIMLFGVRVVVDPMRKSVSMNNLSQYQHPPAVSNDDNGGNSKGNISAAERKEDSAAGYASADDAVPNSGGNRERKRGSIRSLFFLSFLYFFRQVKYNRINSAMKMMMIIK